MTLRPCPLSFSNSTIFMGGPLSLWVSVSFRHKPGLLWRWKRGVTFCQIAPGVRGRCPQRTLELQLLWLGLIGDASWNTRRSFTREEPAP